MNDPSKPRAAIPSASDPSRLSLRVRLKSLEVVVGVSLTGLVLGLAALATAAGASETINYSYDARGRLVTVAHSGTVNNGVVTNYSLDRADNRLGKTTTQ